MNIEQAKAIAIAEIMNKLELQPVKDSDTDAVYSSPFRDERTPSFHVDKINNIWFDHGEGIGGNAFELVVQMLKARGFAHLPKDALRWFRNTKLDPNEIKPRDPVRDKKSKWKVIKVDDLEDLALIRYLKQRGINVELAKQYVKEVYVRKENTLTKMYAIGFKNEDGGYELRNKFAKSCVAPKTISFIRAKSPKPDCVMIFEGFIDFLTYLTLKNGKLPHDIIVLNSVACVDHAIRYIKNYGYKIAYTWMDNDKAGEKARTRLDQFIQTEKGLLHHPLNYLYIEHKDVNEWHMNKLGLPARI